MYIICQSCFLKMTNLLYYYLKSLNLKPRIFSVFDLSCIGNWQEVLQQYISPDQLPAMYGGTRYEPDAQCSKYIRPGRDVPEKYYLSNLKEANKEDMERVVVGRGSSHKVCCFFLLLRTYF